MFESRKQKDALSSPDDGRPEWKILEKVAMASVAEQRRSRRWGILFKSLTFGYLFLLLAMMLPVSDSNITASAKEHVGLVELDGLIAADTPANANTMAASLRAAFEADKSVSVILAINSPGGSPVQSGYINDEIHRLRELYPDKKIYAVIADLGASGGYYVASAADEIYADKASLVGSIGVISAGFGFNQLMEKAGIDRRIYTAGNNKSFLDAFSPEQEEDREFWQGVLNVTHRQFVEVVKRGRGDRLLDDPEIFSGLIWTGEQAVAKGLIDGLGSVGYVAREVIGVEEIRDYTVVPHPLERYARLIGTSFRSILIELAAPIMH